MYILLHVKYCYSSQILKKLDFLDSVSKNHQVLNLIQSVQWEPICSIRRDGRTDGQTDMTKLIVVFRNFVGAPKNWGEIMNVTSWRNQYFIINRTSEDYKIEFCPHLKYVSYYNYTNQTSVYSWAFNVTSDTKGNSYHQVILVSVHRYSTNSISTL